MTENNTTKSSDRQTSLYRFYSVTGELLYIGIAYVPAVRWRGHAKRAEWWSQVSRSEIEHFPNREMAEAAEKKQIIELRPTFNVIHNFGGPVSDDERAEYLRAVEREAARAPQFSAEVAEKVRAIWVPAVEAAARRRAAQ